MEAICLSQREYDELSIKVLLKYIGKSRIDKNGMYKNYYVDGDKTYYIRVKI